MEDEEDYVAYGTPLEREEDLTSNKRKRQALDQGRLRAGSFSQEVYDENGRRRFHGAFTGGFSAGYYNTVGSKEGWVPQAFTSSRKNRAELAQHRPYDYMDDEEKAEQDSSRLMATLDYDTFGLTAADIARKEAAQELKKRPSVIPGSLLDEVIVPVSRSIGFMLLRKMGWRHGRSIGPKHIAASSDVQREGRKAMLALAPLEQDKSMVDEQDSDVLHSDNDAEVVPRSTPIYVINPKKDRYGFGFDPYKSAPEFRDRRESEEVLIETKHQARAFKSSLFRPNVGRMGGGFGIGALEELGEEDEDVYAPDLEMESVLSDEEAEALSFKRDSQPKKAESRPGVLPGFKPASQSGSKIELFPPPIIPPDFNGRHHFRDSLESEMVVFSYEPPEVAPPDDPQLRKLIDGLATFVARSGQKLESLFMEKQNGKPLFEFLSEGSGHDYYKRKLWEEQKRNKKEATQLNKMEATLDSARRGQMLGEIPLRRPSVVPPEDRARLQAALSSAFTSSTPKAEESLFSSQIFNKDPAKQARFELYLKEKYQGGLRNVHATGKSSLTEWERAQEALEFEVACQNLQSSETNSTATTMPVGMYQKELQAIINERFTVQSADKVVVGQSQTEPAMKYPTREEKPWRPRPLLCKRFNLADPYSGRPPPLPKPRSRTESFILLSNPIANVTNSSIIMEESEHLLDSSATPAASGRSIDQDHSSSVSDAIGSENGEMNIVEKPVDLYKAIFSDEDDDEDVETTKQGVETISAEAAQTALNRLEAGDFLASIGKELGLQVPEFNQMKRPQDIIDEAQASNFMAKSPFPGSAVRPQMLESSDKKSGLSEKVTEIRRGKAEVSETTGVFLDYPTLELSAEHFDVFSKLTSKQSLSKSLLQDSKSEKSATRNESFATKTLESSGDTSDEDSSGSQKRWRSRKRRKREEKHSKREKRKSHHEHKRKKRHEEGKKQSHKHRQHRSRET